MEEGEGTATDSAMRDGATPDGTVPGERAGGPFRARADRDLPDRRTICPFLAREATDGTAEPAIGEVDPRNRCVALGEPVPQSGRQQELVCLTAAHVNCPRHLRGLLLASSPPSPPAREPVAPAVIGAALVLAAALAASFGFLAVRGGFVLPLTSPTPALVAVIASASPSPISIATVAPGDSPSASPTASPLASPSVSPTPALTPSPSPRPTPATPKPTARSDRFALLTRCPTTPDCWIYVIRAGDNLQSIANYFGVSYARILALNPGIGDPTTVHGGDRLKIPTPSR